MTATDRRAKRRKDDKGRRKTERAGAVRSLVHLPILNDPRWHAASRIAKSALKGEASISVASNAVERIGALMDEELPGTFVSQPACKRGCSFCCHVQVEITIPELARAVSFVRERFTSDELDALMTRARDSAEGARGKTASNYPVQPCAFLVEGVCSVYEARPLACRAEHSLNVEPCKLAYEAGKDVLPAQHDRSAYEYGWGVRIALEAKLSEAGFSPRTYELQQSLSIALNAPEALERWSERSDAFQTARMGAGLIAKLTSALVDLPAVQ